MDRAWRMDSRFCGNDGGLGRPPLCISPPAGERLEWECISPGGGKRAFDRLRPNGGFTAEGAESAEGGEEDGFPPSRE